MKTYAEELIEQGVARGLEEGLAKGLAKGLEEGRAKGLEEGLKEGLTMSVLRALAVRGLRVDDEARQRILSCTDPDVLERWLVRALTAATVSDVLGAPPQ
ncbi:hypothetical protein [Myxococcus sp. RHSTA-1-4]|uniref:hypothetical protein n=1 Tax=Myxococcus sp. RHSTA-1-4 TaxID=2874601 RepID=UPI001CBE1F88|nr:hypothetical protein [Myxococcus sp. RHSTA-1-4]MBZ4418663.1 hypothetical protein [Myxococcus sp. RHSTA-1-4]